MPAREPDLGIWFAQDSQVVIGKFPADYDTSNFRKIATEIIIVYTRGNKNADEVPFFLSSKLILSYGYDFPDIIMQISSQAVGDCLHEFDYSNIFF